MRWHRPDFCSISTRNVYLKACPAIHNSSFNFPTMSTVYIRMDDGNPARKFTNGLVALLTGAFTIIWPEMLNIIIAAYLISTGITFFWFRSAVFIGAVSLVAGGFIFAFPNLIPYTFAFFLLFFAFGAILSGGLSILGIVSFLFALIIIGTPEFVHFMIAAFLTFYGVFSLMSWWQFRSANKPE